jgi:N-acetylmuramoyl-L-alanine amidase
MKKGVKKISGKREVPAGIWENWHVSEWLPDTPVAMRNEANVKWELYHVNNGTSELILEKDLGHFRFNERGVGEKYLVSAHVYAANLHSESTMEIVVVANEKPAILSIALSDVNDKKLTKPAFAGQIINVHVQTVGMVGHHVSLSLWEDEVDAKGKTTGSKKLTLDTLKKVGSKGIAHCQFVIPSDGRALFRALTGQGNQHVEYHVAAYALGILKASAQTPRVDPEVRKAETKDKVEGVVKPKPSVPPVKRNVPVVTPKPTTPAVPPAKPLPPVASPKREITGVYFTDDKGKFITKAGYNSIIRVVINSIGLVGSKFKMSVLDKDTFSNDVLIDAKEYTFTGNSIYVTIPLTVKMQEAGGDFGYQNLFVDIVVLAASKHLVTVPINVDIKATEKDPVTNITKFVVEKVEVPKTDGKCICKEYDLIWGDKVNCDFRKKVVEIAKDLWPKNFLEMANNLMAVFEWESGGTFKPDVPNQAKSGATGLIQFMPDKAKEYFGKCTMEVVPNYFNSKNEKLHNLPRVKEFAAMTALKQLDYVKRYFEPLRNRKLEFIDFYLQVLFPISSGKPEHVVFANSKDKLDLSESESLKLKRVDKYAKNSGLDVNNDGKVMKSEIAKSVNKYLILGQSHKSISKCENVKEEPTTPACKKDCICIINPVVVCDNFVSNERVSVEHISFIEHGKMNDIVKGIVLHRTENYTTKQTINAFNNKRDGVYYGAHFIVGKDGDITQTAGFDKFTYHAAVTKKPALGIISNSNSIGIEVVGKYEKKKDSVGKWEDVSDIQAQGVVCLVRMLLRKYNLTFNDNIYCHDEISSKTDGEGTVVYKAIKKYF